MVTVNRCLKKGDKVNKEESLENPTQIRPEYTGVASVNSFLACDSVSRQNMFGNHFAQRVPLVKYDKKVLLTGTELDLADTMNDIRLSHDSVVRASIPGPNYLAGKEKRIPVTNYIVVEYEDEFSGVPTVVMDVIEAKGHHFDGVNLGFPYEETEAMRDLATRQSLPKDTVLKAPSSRMDDGTYAFGLQSNICFMTLPAVAEDGVIISESYAERSAFWSVENRSIMVDEDTFPLNLYGNDDGVYKVFPEIGEHVLSNGLLMAVRSRDRNFSPTDLQNTSLMRTAHIFDQKFYVRPGSEIVDITVYKSFSRNPTHPSLMVSQMDAHVDNQLRFCHNLKSQVKKLISARKNQYGNSNRFRVSPRLHMLLVRAEAVIRSNDPKEKLRLMHRRAAIVYRIEITTRCKVTPTKGFKLTDMHGGKGVVCAVWPDERMPRDKNGVQADVITDPESIIARMNLGRSYEAYFGAYCRDNTLRLKEALLQKHPIQRSERELFNRLDNEDFAFIRNFLHAIYFPIGGGMAEFLQNLSEEEFEEHVRDILKEGIRLFIPPNSAKGPTPIIRDIEKSPFRPTYGPVTYISERGVEETTHENIRVGGIYLMWLDNIPNKFLAVSSSHINGHGFPVKLPTFLKKNHPHAQTPTKLLGETEVRLLTSVAGPRAAVDLMEAATSLSVHKELVSSVLSDPKPTSPKVRIDREKIPRGTAKGRLILKHMSTCLGFVLKYKK